jgi:hypothetical protein
MSDLSQKLDAIMKWIPKSFLLPPEQEEFLFLLNGLRTNHDGFIAGAQAMRKTPARLFEAHGYGNWAHAMRREWNPAWGKGPGKLTQLIKFRERPRAALALGGPAEKEGLAAKTAHHGFRAS